MTAVRRSAFLLGLLLLALGTCGLCRPFLWVHPIRSFGGPDTRVAVRLVLGYLFGLFHVNLVLSAAWVTLGLLGLAAAGGYATGRLYAMLLAVACLAAAVLGLIPGLDSLLGLCPLNGYDVWLHLSLAGAAVPFGFLPRRLLDDPVPA